MMLPDRCEECGAPLLGGWTIHSTECGFYLLMTAIFPEYMAVKDEQSKAR